MSRARRREMVDREHPSLSLVRQCGLLGVSRSSIYYRPRVASQEDLSLMGEIDRQYLETPFYGSRRMKAWLERRGVGVSRKRVQRLTRAMGLRAIYRRPGTSRRSPEHPVYPYLLRNVRITRPNQSLPPHGWAIGHTFEYTFDLPKPDNAGNRSTKAKQKPSRKPQRKNTSKSTQKAGKPALRPEPTPAETEAKRE